MNLIICVDKNYGIGRDDKLLFKISDDLKFFKKMTTNKVVVMGYNTFISLPNCKPLKNRTNIILTKKNLVIDNAIVVNSISKLFNELKNYKTQDIFVIGGEQVYKELTDFCELAYITKVNKITNANKFAPNLDKNQNWKQIQISEKYFDKDLEYIFTIYKNLNPKGY